MEQIQIMVVAALHFMHHESMSVGHHAQQGPGTGTPTWKVDINHSVRQLTCFLICLLEAAYSLSLVSRLGPHHSTDLQRTLSDD